MGNQSLFKHDTYAPTNRPKVLRECADNHIEFLSIMDPTRSRAEIQSFVESTIRSSLKVPEIEYLTHPSYGNTERKVIDLLTYTNNIKNNIMTPSGSVYVPPSVLPSLLREALKTALAQRKVYKKEMLHADEAGDYTTAAIKNFLQSSTKIFCNSIPGAMGSPHNAFYDKPGYNSITSTARHSVMCGYAQTEKLIAGNIYVTDYDDVVNYCIIHHRAKPEYLMDVVEQYGLYVPTPDDLMDFFAKSLRHYTRVSDLISKLMDFFISLPTDSRVFIFYANNLYNLVTYNDEYFRSFFENFFKEDVKVNPNWDPGKIFKVEGDLRTAVLSLHSNIFSPLTLENAVKEKPDAVRFLLGIAAHMRQSLADTAPIWQSFFRVDCDTAKAMYHPNMVREAVLVSDTDSVIFTTYRILNWYMRGEFKFGRASNQLNAFSVFVLSQTLEHVFARVSVGFGFEGDDVYRIVMKNEFHYPVMIRTPKAKHYAGIYTIKEGNILPKPKKDIKGRELRDSALGERASENTDAFITWVMETTMKENSLSLAETLAHVASHEAEIYKETMAGRKTFISTRSIRPANEYKGDPTSTVFFYYMLWQEVFAPVWGDFVLPDKAYHIPLIDNGKCLTDPEYHDIVSKFDPKITERLVKFLNKHALRRPTQLLIPTYLPEIPEIFRAVIDVRSLISANCAGQYLILQALGVRMNVGKDSQLVSDFVTGENVISL